MAIPLDRPTDAAARPAFSTLRSARPVLGRHSVLAVARGVTVPPATADADRVQSSRSAAVPTMSAEERLLLGIVDGRLSVARLARMSGLSEAAVVRHLASLCGRGLLVLVAPPVVTIEGRTGEPVYRLGHYDIGARVGQGGMGDVYVSRRTGASGFRRLFAVKVVRQRADGDSLALQSFVRELRVGQLLNHPNVQSVVDVGMNNEEHFLVLDYVEGTDLEELAMFVGGPFDPSVVVTVLLDLLRGLQRAHDTVDEAGQLLGLVHGDVSLSNILVGVDGVTRLADFGSAHFAATEKIGPEDGVTVGKPAFMAPEQLRREPLDARTDLFAVGVVMWTLLTGRNLFSGATYEEIRGDVLGKAIPPPSAYGAPRCLDAICLRALNRQPRDRYSIADHLAADLLRVAVPSGLLASPTRVGNYVRGHLGNALIERHKQIEAGFRSVPRAAGPTRTVSSAAAASGVSAVPAVPRNPIAPTVVLPVRASASSGASVAAPPRGKRPARFDGRKYLYLLVALAVVLSAEVAAVVGNLSRLTGHAHRRAVATVLADP
jgi:serine/threonine-protein kinase